MPSKKPKCPIVVRQAKLKKCGLPNGKFYYATVGRNGEDMNVSQQYPTKYGANRGKDDLIDLIELYLIESGRVVRAPMKNWENTGGNIGDALKAKGII